MDNTPFISIISPVYKAENIVSHLVDEIHKAMDVINKPYEIILVDDRSPDNVWSVMKSLSEKYAEVKSVRLSRNFGQHPAIMAGLSFAKGEWVVVMDCDLQDQPKEIIKLLNKAKEGYDVVLAQRKSRKDSFLKRMSSSIFSKIYSYFTETNYDNEVANFGIYNRKVIDAVLQMPEKIKFFPLFVIFTGFKNTAIEVEHAERFSGTTSYSFFRLLSLAFNTIISFSNKPLKLFVKFGLTISAISFLSGVYYLIKALRHDISVLGYSSIIVSLWFLSGVIITTIGVCGIYIGKIFDQVKGRQVYIIDEIV